MKTTPLKLIFLYAAVIQVLPITSTEASDHFTELCIFPRKSNTAEYNCKCNVSDVEPVNENITVLCPSQANPDCTIAILSHYTLLITRCSAPNTSFAEILNSLKRKSIKNVIFTQCNEECYLNSSHFENLNDIESLDLSNNNFTTLEPTIFTKLNKLKKVVMRHAFDNNNVSLHSQLFANNSLLEDVDLSSNNLVNLPGKVFDNCKNLKFLNLSSNSLATLPRSIFEFTRNLEHLSINHNQLEILGDDFSSLSKLEILELSFNKLTRIDSEVLEQASLLKLDLSWNQLENVKIRIKNLQKVNLSHNRLTKVPKELRDNLKELRELDLSYNNITELYPEDYQYKAQSANINYSNNQINKIDFTGLANYFRSLCKSSECKRSPINFNLENNPIKCDCDTFELMEHITMKKNDTFEDLFVNLSSFNFHCHNPPELEKRKIGDIKLSEFTCEFDNWPKKDVENCTAGCGCSYRPADKTIIVNCSASNMNKLPSCIPTNEKYEVELLLDNNNLTSISDLSKLNKIANITKITLSFNKLQNIDDVELPETLKELRLDHNNLTNLDEKVIKQFEKLTKLLLGYNPWKCDCAGESLYKFIQADTKNKTYKSDIRCDNGELMIKLDEDAFCQTKLIISSVLFTGVVIGILLTLYYRSRKLIYAILYQWKWTRPLVMEKEDCKSKKFDAYISCSENDEDFVNYDLIPLLELGGLKYKVFVHRRDAEVGDCPTDVIIENIRNSKRTIILLTPSYTKNYSCRYEFNTAYTESIREKRNSVIVVMLRKVEVENLHHELKTYVKTRTYLEWGYPLFWTRLKYALPHPQIRRGRKI